MESPDAIARSERIEALIAEGMTQDEALAIVDQHPDQIAAVAQEEEQKAPDHSLAEATEDGFSIGGAADPVPEMAASDIPAVEIPEPFIETVQGVDTAKTHIDEEPELTEHQEAVKALGVGGRIEIEVDQFRVVTGSRPPAFGHGKTIEAALYALKHPPKA